MFITLTGKHTNSTIVVNTNQIAAVYVGRGPNTDPDRGSELIMADKGSSIDVRESFEAISKMLGAEIVNRETYQVRPDPRRPGRTMYQKD